MSRGTRSDERIRNLKYEAEDFTYYTTWSGWGIVLFAVLSALMFWLGGVTFTILGILCVVLGVASIACTVFCLIVRRNSLVNWERAKLWIDEV